LVLEKLDRPGMALLDHLRGHAHVILIDAVLSAEHRPGTWLTLQREELALLVSPASSHGIGVAEALAMGETLGLLPQRLDIWGVVVAG
jgi:hydrogenase maturation protease